MGSAALPSCPKEPTCGSIHASTSPQCICRRSSRTIALAAQRYGIIVRDQSLSDIGFFAEDPTQYGAKPYTASDPYYGVRRDADGTAGPLKTAGRIPNALFDGMWPSEFFHYFPWRSLQVLKMSLHRAS